jgi:hypothetical protein
LAGELAIQVGPTFSAIEWTALRFSALFPTGGGAFTRLDTGFNLGSPGMYFGGGVGASRFAVSQSFVFARVGYALARSAPAFRFEARYERHSRAASDVNLLSVGFGLQLR